MSARTLLLVVCALPVALPVMAAYADTLAITGARVHTVSDAGTIENATILVEDGRIAAIGTDIAIPSGARRLEAAGKIITPGLFTPLGQIGLTEVNAVAGTVDFVQRGDHYTAGFDVADAYNPRSTLVAVNRMEGITRAAIAPAAAEPDMPGGPFSRVLSGLGAIVQLGDQDPALVKRRAMLVAYLGEDGAVVAGGSRAAALLELQSALDDARDYAQNKAGFERGARRNYSVSFADLGALQPVIDGTIPVLAHVDRASDIRILLRIAKEYELRLIIAGGAEAWMVADEIADAGVGVILSSINNLPSTFDQLNARLDAGALLAEAGVRVALGGDRSIQDHNARNITQAAGIAVANGMTWEDALEAITLAPAVIYGMADRIGSIETGKDADLVLWSEDPLELRSYPDAVFIEGRAVPMQSRQTLLRDRYLDSDDPRPPAFRR